MKKLVTTILLICLMSISIQSQETMNDYLDNLNLLSEKLLLAETYLMNLENKIMSLEKYLREAHNHLDVSETQRMQLEKLLIVAKKLQERQAVRVAELGQKLMNACKSLETSQSELKENEKKYIVNIDAIKKQHKSEIRKAKIKGWVKFFVGVGIGAGFIAIVNSLR